MCAVSNMFWKAINENNTIMIKNHCPVESVVLWKLISFALQGASAKIMQRVFKPERKTPDNVFGILGVSRTWNIYTLLDLIVACDLVTKNVVNQSMKSRILKILKHLGNVNRNILFEMN